MAEQDAKKQGQAKAAAEPGLFLPASLRERTGEIIAVERPAQGCNFDVTIVTAAKGRFVVKTGDTPEKIADLEKEARVLSALEHYRLFVPGFVARDESRFLLTCIEGVNLAVLFAEAAGNTARRQHLALQFGQALRSIHDWTPDLPRPADWRGDARRRCAENVASGRIAGPLACDSIFDGQDADAVLAGTLAAEAPRAPFEHEIVFVHGDWCLPNALAAAQGDSLVGAVDWSAGGYADRRFDLATGLWTIRYNTQDADDPARKAYLRTFLDAYGYAESVESLAWFEALYVLM